MGDSAIKNNVNEETVGLLDYVVILSRHSQMIVIVPIAVTLLVYLFLCCANFSYKSKALLFPPQQNLTMSTQLLEGMQGAATPWKDGGGGMSGGMSGMAAGLLHLKSSSEMYVAIMNSDTMADRMIKRLNLREAYQTKYIEEARLQLRQVLKISTNKDLLIQVEATAKDPKYAAEMVNVYIDELGMFLQDLTVQEAKARLDLMEKERLEAARNLSKAEEDLRSFSEQKSVIQIEAQSRAMLEYIGTLRAEIDAKEVQIQVLRQQATPLNFDLIRMETELKGMKEKLVSAECKIDPSASVCLTTTKVPALGLEYLRLFREVKFQESIYQVYTKIAAIARLDMVKNLNIVQVVDRPIPPEQRANRRATPSLFAGAGAFLFMIMVAFLLEFWHQAQANEAQASRFTLIKNYLQDWLRVPECLSSIFKKNRPRI